MRPDRAQYLRAASRIIRNLRRAGRFDELPSYVQYEALRGDAGQREEFGRVMRERFGDTEALRRDAVDEDIAGEVGESDGMFDDDELELIKDLGMGAGVERLIGRNGRPRRAETSGGLQEEGEIGTSVHFSKFH